jgi:hypothetical protein
VGQSKLAKAVGEFSGYLTADTGRIPYHGERYHAGEVISTSFVEFAVNQLVSKPIDRTTGRHADLVAVFGRR